MLNVKPPVYKNVFCLLLLTNLITCQLRELISAWILEMMKTYSAEITYQSHESCLWVP